MKKYVKYVILLIVFVLIGGLSIHLYQNIQLKNDFKKEDTSVNNKKTTTAKDQESLTTKKETVDVNTEKNTSDDGNLANAQTNPTANHENVNTILDKDNTSTSNNNSNLSKQSDNITSDSTSNNQNSTTSNSNTSQSDHSSEESFVTVEVENNSSNNTSSNTTSASKAKAPDRAVTSQKTDSMNDYEVIEIEEQATSTSNSTSNNKNQPSQSTTSSSNSNSNNNNSKSNNLENNSTNQVTKITLNKTQAAIGDRSNVEILDKKYQNNYVQLKVTSVIPDHVQNKEVTWSVIEGKQNIKLNQNGEVYGLNGGTAIVRATSKNNPNVYAECKITIVHSLYINAKLISNVTATKKYSNDTISLKKGQQVVVLKYFRHKTRDNYKNLTYTVRLLDGTLVELKGKYMKFSSYYIDKGYDNSIYEDYINNNGFTSKTNYLIWVNQGTQRLLLFKKQKGIWKIVENFKTSTGDVEGKNTGDNGGSTTINFNLEVRDFNSESQNPSIGRAIHMQNEKTKKYFGNTIHVGSLPNNAVGGNPSENQPSSHGCPHISVSFRNKLYNTYNKKTKNELIGSKVIYY